MLLSIKLNCKNYALCDNTSRCTSWNNWLCSKFFYFSGFSIKNLDIFLRFYLFYVDYLIQNCFLLVHPITFEPLDCNIALNWWVTKFVMNDTFSLNYEVSSNAITIEIQWCACLHNEKCVQLHASYQFTVCTVIRSCDLCSFYKIVTKKKETLLWKIN